VTRCPRRPTASWLRDLAGGLASEPAAAPIGAPGEPGPAAGHGFELIQQPDERRELGREHWDVLRRRHTERPCTGKCVRDAEKGASWHAGWGSELFRLDARFDPGTGWPGFYESAIAQAVALGPGNSLFMCRTKVVYRRCGGHLGPVFSTGQVPAGERYRINSCAWGPGPSPQARDQGDDQPGQPGS
jgi:peptide-methionine (R)-S-oxide reductase